MANERCAIFIDAGYLEKVLEKEFDRASIDYGKFADGLTGADRRLRAYYYNCPPFISPVPTSQERTRQASADRFYAALRRLPRFEVRLGRLAKRHCPECSHVIYQQKRVDIQLAVDLVNLSAKRVIGRAVLVAGDSDLIPAIEAAKESGVVVHLFHGGSRNPPHQDLLDMCDERTRIDQGLIDRSRRR